MTNTAQSQSFRTAWKTKDTKITIPTSFGLYNYSITWKNITNKKLMF
ncbi:hypothetical protein Fleli_3455 [Bernardetia litoralis DSM 6794]|uniref:Uncharacterized protein n=1 Tax=Bernardetia litoralis (strain ATCC 23117 / DSM 6794 / NBRC 15988 / NCIMB 1366 / Fx l1 / Sio-4) TaxID=880071 RepID=I4AP90_BERLS|nr:hypothetical protein [Bernardetia litoralis]AFM05775.1 hypothetical protein Fleli_3455 [Bernardetia litoralis DSM 6794]